MAEDQSPNAESDAPEYGIPTAYTPAGSLTAYDVGRWVFFKGLDRPKQIIYVSHGEHSTSVQWYRDPVKRDAKSFGTMQHSSMVMLYIEEPTRVTPPGGTS